MTDRQQPDAINTAQPRKHPDELAGEIRRLLRAHDYALVTLTFHGKHGGTHTYE